MNEWFSSLPPVTQALLATLFTWSVTAAGASLVFLTRAPSVRFQRAMLGFAAGVMIAASFWSLLSPALEMAAEVKQTPWLVALLGFLSGGAFIWGLDRVLPHLHPGLPVQSAEGPRTHWRKSVLLVLAITLHNIPEGMAVGVAFGGVAHGYAGNTLGAAVALAIGIGLQNFPEGTAVALPLRHDGLSRGRAFFYGQLSAAVEPVAGVVGALAVSVMRELLPFSLSFAAGAMIFVVVEELIPQAQAEDSKATDLPSICAMLGFGIMMVLDVTLG